MEEFNDYCKSKGIDSPIDVLDSILSVSEIIDRMFSDPLRKLLEAQTIRYQELHVEFSSSLGSGPESRISRINSNDIVNNSDPFVSAVKNITIGERNILQLSLMQENTGMIKQTVLHPSFANSTIFFPVGISKVRLKS